MNTTSIKSNWRRGLAGLLALGALLACGIQPSAGQTQGTKPGVYDWGDDASGQLAQGIVGGSIAYPVRAEGALTPGASGRLPRLPLRAANSTAWRCWRMAKS